MKLKPIQLSILLVQILAILLNIYAIFVKKTQDTNAHVIAIVLILIIMFLSIKSWIDANKEKQALKRK